MNEIQHIDTAWQIDPATVQRLWPVIDVYGRINRALAARAHAIASLESRLGGTHGSAA